MTLRIYNTLTRTKDPFTTIEPGKVRLYVCGPTVYAEAHIGHAMSALVFDIVRRIGWPSATTGRALHNRFIERWHGHEHELTTALEAEQPAFQAAQQGGDFDTAMVWAGEAVDLILSVEPAAQLVERIAVEAERRLAAASNLLR